VKTSPAAQMGPGHRRHPPQGYSHQTCLFALWLLLWSASFSDRLPAQPPPQPPAKTAPSAGARLQCVPSEVGTRFVQNYGQDEFRSLPQTWGVIQDARGVLYVANDTGLLIYDSVRWQQLTLPNSATVRSLDISPDGQVYLGAENELGYLTATPQGAARFVSLLERLPPDKRRFGSVWRTWATPEGIFFQTYRYLFHLIGESVHVHEPAGQVARDDFVWSHWINDRLYVHQRHVGLLLLGKDEVLRLAPGGELFAERRVCALLPFDQEHLLAVTQEDGLWLYAPDTGAPRSLPLRPRPVQPIDFNHACVLADGRIAIGSNHDGVLVCDRQGRLMEVIGRQAGLSSPSVHWVYSDRQGGLWAAHRNGLARIEVGSRLSYFDEATGLEGRVFALHRHAGRLYAGTLAGLFALDDQPPGALVAGQARFVRVPGMDTDCWHMATDGDRMLVATGSGLYEITPRPATPPGVKKLDIEGRTYVLHPDPIQAGRFYVGTRRGLFRLTRHGAGWKVEAPVFGLQEEVRSLTVTDEGLWCGTMHRGACFIPEALLRAGGQADSSQVIRIDERVGLPTQRETFVARVNGQACLATQRGVYVFDPRGHTLRPADAFAALREAPVFRFGQDAQGGVWYARDFSERGVLRPGPHHHFEPDTQVLRLPPASLLRTILCEPEGITWLGGDKGLFRYAGPTPQPPRAPGQLLIRRLETGGQVQFAGDGNLPAELPPLDYTGNRLRCEVALLSFPREREHRFRFRLDGSDRQWSDWSHETVKEYTNLSEGEYTLRVEAQDLYGQTLTMAPVRLRILPPWYRTWWAYSLAVGFIGCLIVGGIRFRERLLIERNRALEHQVRERTSEITRQRDEILDSIRYAERIQKAVLPTLTDLRQSVPESFILYAPRDIVSGDFYWIHTTHEGVILTVADCTGHGVPGAFMSLIGNDLLNQIVIERGIRDPAQILTELDAGIVAALGQKTDHEPVRVHDGLDAGILHLSPDRQQAGYAGARRPLYLVGPGGLTEIKGDLRSVGGTGRREARFTSHHVQLEAGTMLYLTTDGFADQSNQQGKKYGTRRLRSLLCELAAQPVEAQRARLEQVLHEHAGTERLRDDVTIVGLRI